MSKEDYLGIFRSALNQKIISYIKKKKKGVCGGGGGGGGVGWRDLL